MKSEVLPRPIVSLSDAMVVTHLPPAQRAPLRDFSVDFNRIAVDVRPAELRYRPVSDQRAIRVVRGEDIPGGACLLFSDGPEFVNRYDPHAFVNVEFETGQAVGKFALRFDPSSQFIYEWRNGKTPYQTGPILKISAKGVETHDRLVTKLIPGQWFDFEVAAHLGDKAGTWRLSITEGRKKTQVFDNLTIMNKDWKQLKWLGFISNSNEIFSSLCGKNQHQ